MCLCVSHVWRRSYVEWIFNWYHLWEGILLSVHDEIHVLKWGESLSVCLLCVSCVVSMCVCVCLMCDECLSLGFFVLWPKIIMVISAIFARQSGHCDSVWQIVWCLMKWEGGGSYLILRQDTRIVDNSDAPKIFSVTKISFHIFLHRYRPAQRHRWPPVGHPSPAGTTWPILIKILKVLQFWPKLVVWSIFGRRTR